MPNRTPVPQDYSRIPTDWAWAAGFFDGEGHCGKKTRDSGQYYPFMVVAQHDPQLLIRWQKIAGCGVIRFGRHSTSHRLDVNGEDLVTHVAEEMWEYLGQPKRKQIAGVLSLCYQQRPGWTSGGTPLIQELLQEVA